MRKSVKVAPKTSSFNACKEFFTFLRTVPTFLKELTVGRLASMYGINRSYLSKSFKKCRGITLGDFLKRIKLLRCALLMKEKRHLTVKQVSRKMGFNNMDYFIKLFSGFLGVRPEELKKIMF